MLEGVFLVTAYCGLMYVLPMLAFVFLVLDRLHYTQRLGATGVVLCILAPLAWAIYNPLGVWFLLLPILAPSAFASYVIYVNAKRRISHRTNPTNLLEFRARERATPRKSANKS